MDKKKLALEMIIQSTSLLRLKIYNIYTGISLKLK